MTSNLILIGENKLKNVNNKIRKSTSTKIANKRKKLAHNDENKSDDESELDSELLDHVDYYEESGGEEGENNKNKNSDGANDIIQVNCNSFVGELYKKKLGSGSKGRCIRVIVKNNGIEEEKWLTPIEFENYCGKGNCKDWKKTIKVGGQSILTLLESNVLLCHAVSCGCGICNENDSLVGPIVPFVRYRRRKKDEKQMVNAYKKFLNLKPPTLLFNQALSNLQNSNNNSNLLPIASNNNSNLSYNSEEDAVSKSQTTNEDNENSSDYDSTDLDHNEEDDDVIFTLKKYQKTQMELFQSIEQKVESILSDTQLVKKQLDKAKKDLNSNFSNLIDKIQSLNEFNDHSKLSQNLSKSLKRIRKN